MKSKIGEGGFLIQKCAVDDLLALGFNYSKMYV